VTPAFKAKVAVLPAEPGVYLMKGADGAVLYIGKAREIKKRVRSYLSAKQLSPKIAVLMTKVADLEIIETPTEMDALILESQLIHKYSPRYNTLAKDDKTFPFIKITRDDYPMIHITRRQSDRSATYYGPFTDAGLLREAVQIINRIFPLRKCVTLPKQACLYYHIGQCLAPCIKPEIKPEYDRLVKEVKDFIGSGKKSFMQYLTDRMQAASEKLAFEEAQFFKEQIQALGNLKKKRFYRGRDISGVKLTASSELSKALGLRRFPERICCFDVSNISGKDAVASRVSFYYEMPDKNEYRRYKIKSVAGIDDYSMMQEALRRMFRGIKTGREAFVPDLIMIDGGKGHLRCAYEVALKEGFGEIAMISIAKQFEYLYTTHAKKEVVLKDDSRALYLVKRIRDEAHRFAITYYRKLHSRHMSESQLDEIAGVGPRRKRALLKRFQSLEALRDADPIEIGAVLGMTTPLALKVLAYLRDDPA